MKTSNVIFRGLLIVGVAAGLGACSMFGRSGSNKAEGAAATAAGSSLGAADAGDAVPRDEPLNPDANKWYGANGRLYRPITDDREFKERGKASVIAGDDEGKPTASGESYAPRGMTAAHSRLPIPSYARVTDLRTGKTAIVRINDRGAYDRDEAIALSAAAAQRIGLAGNDEVEVERITPAMIAAMPSTRAAAAAAPAAAPAPQSPPPPVAEVAPQAAQAPAEPTPLAPQPIAATPAPMPVAAPPAPAPVAAAPAAPVAAAVAPSAARKAVPARAPSQSTATGRWSVQVAAFVTPTLAESTRARVEQQLAQGAPNLAAADRTPRVERFGNRSYVLLGDFSDRDAAEALAGRLRAVLRQDVVVERH